MVCSDYSWFVECLCYSETLAVGAGHGECSRYVAKLLKEQSDILGDRLVFHETQSQIRRWEISLHPAQRWIESCLNVVPSY